MDLPRPEVTVTDPRQPGALVPAEEPVPPRLGRRGAALLAVAALVGGCALVAADVARDREEAAEQRRLDGVVDVALGVPSGRWSASHDPRTGTGTVGGLVRLSNNGPRDLRITAAELGSLRYTGERVLFAGDGGTVLPLRRTVRCPRDGGPPPPEPEPQELRLRLETPAGPRVVSLEGSGLPVGSLDDGVQTACAYPPLRDSVQLAGTVVATEGRSAVLQVDVANEGRQPVRLLSVVPARGLVVQAVDGGATRLPVVLAATSGSAVTRRTLELRVAVVCSALLGADLLRPLEELSLIVEDEDRSQLTAVGALASDPDGRLRQLAERTCSSG